MIQDVTERKRAEAERVQLAAQLQQAQKLDALGTLAGGIAHDFNNILSGIMGNTELSRMDLPPDHPVQEFLGETLQASLRAKALVRQILTFSRKNTQERTLVQPWPVLQEALKLLRASLPSSFDIQIKAPSSSPFVFADATQLHQVMMNLGTNAAQAMTAQGGCLEVTQTTIDVDEEMVRANPRLKSGRYVRITVRDNGSGMDAATLERIFDPFFTTKPPGKGTGLGLAVVHGIIENHDGAITVQSTPGQGTTFQLFLPVVAQELSEAEAVADGFPLGHGERILLVDDERIVMEMAKRLLERAGYQVTAFIDAAVALQTFRANPTQFDIVITDFAMPQISGLTLSEDLLRLRPGLPIIISTGFDGRLNEEKARRLGIWALVAKPYTIQDLAHVVRRALDKDQSGKG